MRREYLQEGAPAASLNSRVSSLIENEGLMNVGIDSTKSVGFCGFLVEGDFIAVSLPKTIALPDEDDVELCKLLFRTLQRYYHEASFNVGDKSDIKDDIETLSSFHMLNELLDDWSRYGVYRNRINEEKVRLTGHVNWKKTIKHVLPFLNHNGTPIYPKFHTRNRRLELEKTISDLHRSMVASADTSIGWLKASNLNGLMFPEISCWNDKLPCDNLTALRLLNRELRKQFDQRKVRLLKLMVDLITKNITTPDISKKRFGVKYFWPIWEEMCRSYLLDQSSLHGKALPQPKYLSDTGSLSNYSSNIGQRPDIIIGDRDGWIEIVDAKYYDVRVGVPGWKDIVKQFFYAGSFKAIGYAKKTKNVFLFPFSGDANVVHPDRIEMKIPKDYVPVTPIDKGQFFNVFPSIKCLYLDVVDAMRSYTS